MSRSPTTKLAASGHRFLRRRREIALLGGDPDAPHDPLRAQSTALGAGVVLAGLVLAVAAVLALLRPQPALGDVPIALDRDSGALYVRVGDIWHPVLNLASARLIVGVATDPVAVAPQALAAVPRGTTLGIPGAPAVIAPQLGGDQASWTVCDTTAPGAEPDRTIVVAGPATPGDQLRSSRALLVSTGEPPAATAYLVYDGQRAVVDLDDPAVVRALALDGVAPRKVSQALLNVIPEVPALAVPTVQPRGAGSPLAGFVVGSVVMTNTATGAQRFVVLPDGLQLIGRVTADLIRFADARGQQEVVAVSPDVVAGLPRVSRLAVDTYPDEVERVPETAESAVVCAHWSPSGVAVWVAAKGPTGLVDLAQADGAGPLVDAVGVPAGRSAFVSAAGLTDTGTDSVRLHLVTDTGGCFGVGDVEDAAHLGLVLPAPVAPSAVLELLPRGPLLTRSDALVARDVVPGEMVR